MSAYLAWLIVAPLAWAIVLFLMGRWPAWRRVQLGVALGAQASLLFLALAVLLAVADGTYLVHHASNWPPPYGIALVADRLSGLLVAIGGVVFLAALLYSVSYVPPEALRETYLPLFFVLQMGVYGAFVTGDLFNLFVFFEVMLLATYGLVITPDAKGLVTQAEKLEAIFRYIVLNLIGASLFLLSIGVLYGTLGTLNFADLHVRIQAVRAAGLTHVDAIAIVLVAVFGLKAAAVPLHFWLPDVHPSAPSPISAILSGLLIKVGAYAIIRLATLLFPTMGLLNVALLVVAFATMFLGGVAALAQHELKRLLAYSSVSQMGFILLGVALDTRVALAAAIFFLVNHAVIKSLLFLMAGGVLHMTGERSIDRMGGLVRRSPVLAVTGLVGFFALAGVPPLNGFVSKLLLFGSLTERVELLVATLAGAFLTIVYSLRAWQKVFWGEPAGRDRASRLPWSYGMAIATLAILCVLLGLGAEPLVAFSDGAAVQLEDPASYVRAVLGGTP